MREHYRRETSWAPHDVHHELRDARLVATGYHRDAILWRAEAEQHEPSTPRRATADADVTAAEHLAARYDARVEHLEVIAAARDHWHRDTEYLRTRHLLAGQELARRGLATEPAADLGEQTALFDIAEPTEVDATNPAATRSGQRAPSLTSRATQQSRPPSPPPAPHSTTSPHPPSRPTPTKAPCSRHRRDQPT